MTDQTTVPKPGDASKSGLRTVSLGFIPLIDCAVAVVAAELGFAQAEGIDLKLKREISWANIRDKVNLGHVDSAHMLAPMPISNSLGAGHVKVPTLAPFALSFNGNAITVSRDLFERMAATGLARDGDPASMAKALARVVVENRESGGEPFTFGMVFPFSCHNYEIRYWLASAGIHPDWDVRLVVIPPPLIVDSLRVGHIQGFCVGEPWNSLAVDAGVGRIVATKSHIWPQSPEKVLGIKAAWAEANPDLVSALIRALNRAAEWAADRANHAELAILLADERYVGAPTEVVRRILAGEVVLDQNGTIAHDPAFILFRRDGNNQPRAAQALWIYSQMLRWGQVAAAASHLGEIGEIFVPSDAASASDAEGIGRAIAFFDGRMFDGTDIAGYLSDFDIDALHNGDQTILTDPIHRGEDK